MRKPLHLLLLLLLPLLPRTAAAQATLTRDIKSFGAKGDGRSDDHAAFERAAAFFNGRGGHGRLIISKGVYLVGKQTVTRGEGGRFGWDGADVLLFDKVQNLRIEGQPGSIIRYRPGFRYGSFDPKNGQPYQASGHFTNAAYGASLGRCIIINEGRGVTISGLSLDGNSDKLVLGGSYGDVGRQLPHYGIFIQNSRDITVQSVNVHHFGQDGICVANVRSNFKDNIRLIGSAFTHNGRQAFSWIGGNDLKATNCKFSYSGQGKVYSAPGAGVDIEAEYGPIRNGVFENCEFVDNKGCALVADSGDSGYCSFSKCTFWGLDNWSVWVTKPGFTFADCSIHGSIVHGYKQAANDREATRYIRCTFEDKGLNGKPAYGGFLIECTDIRRMALIDCILIANQKKLFWLDSSPSFPPEEKYQMTNCKVICKTAYAQGDYAGIFRGVRYKNCLFDFRHPEALKRRNGLNDCCGPLNVDAGGNSTVYAK